MSLDDPAQAAHAWRRFRRVLGASVAVGLAGSLAAIWLVGRAYGALGWIAALATIGGVTFSFAVGGALMALMFMSSGTGHDEAVDAFARDRDAAD